MVKMTFDDEFNSLSFRIGTNGTWQPSYSWSPNGFTASDMTSWFTNPLYGPTSVPDANPYSIKNGVLDIGIKTRPTDVPSSQVGGANYLSGMLTTYPSFSQEYGYFEMRAEMSGAPGTMSAFWLLPTNGSWPPELDIAEVLGNNPTTLANTVHTTTQSAQMQSLTTVPDMSKGFHTYAVDWEASTITWYFDGKQVDQIATPADMHQPMYVLLDTAAGTAQSWEGAPSTGLPAAMQVDYVRVYDSNPYTTPSTSTSTPTLGLTTTSGGSMMDAAGNTWTLTASGSVDKNGTPVPDGSGTSQFTIVNNIIYAQDAGGTGWYTYSTASQTWSGSPAPTINIPQTGLITTSSGGTLKDAAGNTWTLTASGSVDENGAPVPGSSGTSALTISNNVVYGQDAGGTGWYTYSTASQAWSSSSAPPITQTQQTVSLSDVSIAAASGNNMVFIKGSRDTISLSGGTNTITDTGHGNSYVIPVAGKGYDTFTSNIFTASDLLDLRSALAATNWSGATSTLSNFLHVADTNQGAVLSISQFSGQAGIGVATISGATTSRLADVLAHSLV